MPRYVFNLFYMMLMRIKGKQLFTVTFSFTMGKCFYQMWLCVLLNRPAFYPSASPSRCDVWHQPCPSIPMFFLCEDIHSHMSSSCLLGSIGNCFHQQISTESEDTKAAMWFQAFVYLDVCVHDSSGPSLLLNWGGPKPVVMVLLLQARAVCYAN